MTERSDTGRVLQMLANGKVSVEEAQALLDKLNAPTPPTPPSPPVQTTNKKPKLLHVEVRGEDTESVSIKVPLKLLRLAGTFPGNLPNGVNAHLEGAGINLANMNELSDEEFYEAFADLSIDVDVPDEKTYVRVYCQ